MTKSELKILGAWVLKRLEKTFPNAAIELDYNKNDPWQLLVVVALSAQSTDKKVNEISKPLFARFNSVKDFAKASPAQVEPYIKTLGLFRNKAKNLVLAAQKVITDFGGHVPKTRDELETLAGVGKKTSAVIVANAFDTPAIAVDTHVSRIAFRLGLTANKNPDKIEEDLTDIYPKNQLLRAHHTFIFHGRRICFAKKPHCSICPLAEKCPQIGVKDFQ